MLPNPFCYDYVSGHQPITVIRVTGSSILFPARERTFLKTESQYALAFLVYVQVGQACTALKAELYSRIFATALH